MTAPLIVVDARRCDPKSLHKTLSALPGRHEVWVLSHERLNREANVVWRTDAFETVVEDLVLATETRSALVVRAGETAIEFELRIAALTSQSVLRSGRWSKFLFIPRGSLATLTRDQRLTALNGDVVLGMLRFELDALLKDRLLFVSHTDLDDHVGGVQAHLRDVIDWLAEKHVVFLLFPSRTGFTLRGKFRSYETALSIDFAWGDRHPLQHALAEEQFKSVLAEIQPKVVHFNHLIGLPFSLVEIARAQTRTMVTLHDYYAFCPRYDLVDANGKFCGFCGKESSCKSAKIGERYDFIPFEGTAQKRRERIRRILNSVEVIVPSTSARQNFVDHLKINPAVIRVLEHPPTPLPMPKTRAANGKRGRWTLAFVGAFSRKKGAEHFARLVRSQRAKRPGLKWKVFGEVVDADIAHSLEHEDGVEFTGAYDRAEIGTLLDRHDVDLGLILSIWPETYSYTLTETIASGCLPVVTNSGALSERVRKLGAGWILDFDSLEKDFDEALATLDARPKTRERKMPSTRIAFHERMRELEAFLMETSPPVRAKSSARSHEISATL